MARPPVSVVMSVFNGQSFLSEAVESVLGQTFPDFEFVIIDDGSTDRTAKILSDYAKRDSRVRIFPQQNKGRAESLNRGIELASGHYVARMDADDVAMPNRLQDQVNFLEQHSDVGLLGGAYEVITSSGQVLGTFRCPLEDAAIRSNMRLWNAMLHSAVVMRKEIALASGGYRKALLDAEDYDLWLRMAERSQLANLPQTLVRYRVHPAQVSIQNMTHQTWCLLAARAAASLRERGSPDPLVGIEEVTPRFLNSLGLTEPEIEHALASVYADWIEILEHSDPELTLQTIDRLLQLSAKSIKRPKRADTWLHAASIHYKQGRPVRALSSVGRGILVRPIIAGRPVKRALVRLAAAFKSWRASSIGE